jgi:hypothetical protein
MHLLLHEHATPTRRCPWCHESLVHLQQRTWQCPGCAAEYHPSCAREAGKCAVLGCARVVDVSAKNVSVVARPASPSLFEVIGRKRRLPQLFLYTAILALDPTWRAGVPLTIAVVALFLICITDPEIRSCFRLPRWLKPSTS